MAYSLTSFSRETLDSKSEPEFSIFLTDPKLYSGLKVFFSYNFKYLGNIKDLIMRLIEVNKK